MKDKSIRPGTKISCIIEQVGDNFIYLLYRHGGNSYRGVLLNEDCSAVRRVIPDGYYPKKAILDQATTDNLQNAVTNHALDTQSKGLRSKKLKQSCIVLDDYDFSSFGKSPIDSIRGLVESIDTSMSLTTKPIATRTATASAINNRSLHLKEVVISPLKLPDKTTNDMKIKGKDEPSKTRRNQVYRKRITEVHFKAAPFDSRGIPAERKSSNYFNRRLAELNLSSAQRKRPSGFSFLGSRSSFPPPKTNYRRSSSPIKSSKSTESSEIVTIPDVKKSSPAKVAKSSPATKQNKTKKSLSEVVDRISVNKQTKNIEKQPLNEYLTRTKSSQLAKKLTDSPTNTRRSRKRKAVTHFEDSTETRVNKSARIESDEKEIFLRKDSDSNASTPNTPTKRPYKRSRRITMKKRHRTSVTRDLTEDINVDIVPSERVKKNINKHLSNLTKPKQKRVDPILVALKNIKKYDSYRRRRNLANAAYLEKHKLLSKPRKLRSGKKLTDTFARSDMPIKPKRYNFHNTRNAKNQEKATESAESSDNESSAPTVESERQIVSPVDSNDSINDTQNLTEESESQPENSTKRENPEIENKITESDNTKETKEDDIKTFAEDDSDMIFPRKCENETTIPTVDSSDKKSGDFSLQSDISCIDTFTNAAVIKTAAATSIQGATTSLLGPYLLLPASNALQKTVANVLSSRNLPFTSSNLSNSSLSAIAMKVRGTKTTTLNRSPLPHTKKRLIKPVTENRKPKTAPKVSSVSNKSKDNHDYFTKKTELMRSRPSIFGAKGMYTPAPTKPVYDSDSEKDNQTEDLDLTCHEKAPLSPDDSSTKSFPVIKKNRRKPLQVFKSLPNPERSSPVKSSVKPEQVIPPSKDEEISLECEEKIEEVEHEKERQEDKDTSVKLQNRIDTKDVKKIKKKKIRSRNEPINAVQLLSQQNEKMLTRKQFSTYMTSHNTRFRGKKSVVPCLKISPVQINKIKHEKKVLPSKNLSLNLAEKIKQKELENDETEASTSKSVTSNISDNEDDAGDNSRIPSNFKIVKKKKVNKYRETYLRIKPLTRKNHEVRIGDIVWGRCHGHGWWPGVVTNIDLTNETRTGQTKWYNSNTQSYMDINNLKLFTPYFDKLFNVSKKSNSYTKAVSDALKACELKYGVVKKVDETNEK